MGTVKKGTLIRHNRIIAMAGKESDQYEVLAKNRKCKILAFRWAKIIIKVVVNYFEYS